MYDEEGVDRTPKQLVQRQMVSARPPPQAALPTMLPGAPRLPSASILGRHHRESRMGSRMSKLSKCRTCTHICTCAECHIPAC